MINDELFEQVILAINKVGERFEDIKGLIISESDMKCLIYSELRKLINENSDIADYGLKGSPLHTEVAHYNPNARNKADKFIDIVLFEPDKFSIRRSSTIRVNKRGQICYNEVPYKGYQSLGDAILIELKFCKYKNGITESFIKDIVYDIDKIQKLTEYNADTQKIRGIVAVFNRSYKVHQTFDEDVLAKDTPDLRIIYKSARLENKVQYFE